ALRRFSVRWRWPCRALLASTHYLVKSSHEEGHPAGQPDRLAALPAREAEERLRRVHVVRDQDAPRPQQGPGGIELEPHPLERVLAVVHERVDRPEAREQWR